MQPLTDSPVWIGWARARSGTWQALCNHIDQMGCYELLLTHETVNGKPIAERQVCRCGVYPGSTGVKRRARR